MSEELRNLPEAVVEKKLSVMQQFVTKLETQLRESAPPEMIKQWILDLCQANDIKTDKEGNLYTSPNWSARNAGLERVFEILKVQTQEASVSKATMPAKIQIQIINGNPENVPPANGQ